MPTPQQDQQRTHARLLLRAARERIDLAADALDHADHVRPEAYTGGTPMYVRRAERLLADADTLCSEILRGVVRKVLS